MHTMNEGARRCVKQGDLIIVNEWTCLAVQASLEISAPNNKLSDGMCVNPVPPCATYLANPKHIYVAVQACVWHKFNHRCNQC